MLLLWINKSLLINFINNLIGELKSANREEGFINHKNMLTIGNDKLF